MASHEIDSVQVEKANAMRRYYNQQKEFKYWVIQLCAALFVPLCTTSWLPATVETAGGLFRRFLSFFDCTFYVFMIVVAIVFILYASSGKNEAKPDLYDEFIQNSDSGRRLYAEKKPPAMEETFHDKHIICSENADSPDHGNLTVSSVITNHTVPRVQSDKVRAVSEKTSPEKVYRRIKSQSSGRQIVEKSRKELRRSETEIHRELVSSDKEPGRRSFSLSVEELNDEDFKRTIEAFIAENKKTQREEGRKQGRREPCLALTLSVQN